ncbi:MAG: hypothetical protein K1Y36_01990 [Blastocatellia bacterium]|nr:hypothetical protein [Blastocatellia bacterium]
MKLRHWMWSLALVFWTVLGSAAQNFGIEAGSRIGKIELGISRTQVLKLLGKATASYALEDKHYLGDLWAGKGTGNNVWVTYRNGIVWQIKVTSPKFSTTTGLTSQSSLSEIRRHHKNLTRSRFFKTSGEGYAIDYYDDVDAGIAFEFINLKASEQPKAFEPYAIIVHEAGEAVLPDDSEEPAT